jgi:sirohydrochlorin cobaltochelatase
MTDAAVLVIAHGSPDPHWMERVEEAVRPYRRQMLIRVAYLDGVEGRDIADEVERLERAGVETIAAVPLFVTAGSTHVSEIRGMLGLEPDAITPNVKPVATRARFLWCQPLEDHPLVEQIVCERLRALSVDPHREALLLVGHGSDLPGYRERWGRLLHRLTFRLQNRYYFSAAGYATLRPDTVATRARQLASCGELVVLPLFVSQGYFTRRALPERLAGVSYRYDGSAYLPHPLIGEWIVQSAKTAFLLDYQTQRSVIGDGQAT